MEGMDLKLTPVVVKCFLGPHAYLGLWLAFLGIIWLVQIVLTEGITHLWLPTLPHHPPHPLPPTHPLIHATRDITVAVKKLLKIQQC